MSQKPNKKMTLMDSVLMAVGGIIGAGIFSITGTAVGAAGPAVPVAFLLAGFFSLMLCVPHMLISSAIPAKGGQYLYVARFLSPLLGFLSIWNSIMHICLVSIGRSVPASDHSRTDAENGKYHRGRRHYCCMSAECTRFCKGPEPDGYFDSGFAGAVHRHGCSAR